MATFPSNAGRPKHHHGTHPPDKPLAGQLARLPARTRPPLAGTMAQDTYIRVLLPVRRSLQ